MMQKNCAKMNNTDHNIIIHKYGVISKQKTRILSANRLKRNRNSKGKNSVIIAYNINSKDFVDHWLHYNAAETKTAMV